MPDAIIISHAEYRTLHRVSYAERIGRRIYDAEDAARLDTLQRHGLVWGVGWRRRLTPLGRAFLDDGPVGTEPPTIYDDGDCLFVGGDPPFDPDPTDPAG